MVNDRRAAVAALPALNKVYAGTDLFSRAAARRVSSAPMSLTSVFGMGTGGTSSSLAPAICKRCFRFVCSIYIGLAAGYIVSNNIPLIYGVFNIIW